MTVSVSFVQVRQGMYVISKHFMTVRASGLLKLS